MPRPEHCALTLDSRLRADPQVVWQQVFDEAVALHLGTEAYFTLDEVGALIWKGIEDGEPLSCIRDRITQEFEVTPEDCESDLLAFAESLVEHQLARLAEPR